MPIFSGPDIQKLKEQKNIKGLQKALRKKDPKIVLEASLALAEFGVYYSPGLIIGTSDNDWKIRRRTYLTYAGLKESGFIPLIVSLYDPHESVRTATISAFLLRGEKRAYKILGKSLLNDPSDLVRIILVPVLARLGGDNSLKYLLMARNDRNSLVRDKVKEELNTRFKFSDSLPTCSLEQENSTAQISIYSMWNDLNKVISEDINEDHSRLYDLGDGTSEKYYLSPLNKSCLEWMKKVGNALKERDERSAYKYIWNIGRVTEEFFANSHEFISKYQFIINHPQYDMIKYSMEFSQASKLIYFSPLYKIWFS